MEFVNREGTIPATEWFKIIIPIMREGYMLKICPAGGSMYPFLVGGRDEAVISLPKDDYRFKKNDIVLYKIENGIHVLHRVHHINKKGIYTLGDAQTCIEGPFARNEIIAVADHIIRKGKKLNGKNLGYDVTVTIWSWMRLFRPYLIIIYKRLRRLGLKMRENLG